MSVCKFMLLAMPSISKSFTNSFVLSALLAIGVGFGAIATVETLWGETAVERTMSQRLNAQSVIPAFVETIACAKPDAGGQRQCTVHYVSGIQVEPINVAVAATVPSFPDEFTFKQNLSGVQPRWGTRLKTSFKGDSMPPEQAVAAVRAATEMAYAAAKEKGGAALEQARLKYDNIRAY